MSKGTNDYCNRCEDFNTIQDGICCRCLWHIAENRPATQDEKQIIQTKLDAALRQLDDVIEKPQDELP